MDKATALIHTSKPPRPKPPRPVKGEPAENQVTGAVDASPASAKD